MCVCVCVYVCIHFSAHLRCGYVCVNFCFIIVNINRAKDMAIGHDLDVAAFGLLVLERKLCDD